MSYFFAEVVDHKIIALHDVTSLDIVFRNSDGLLVELTEKEHAILTACRGDIDRGISLLGRVRSKIDTKWLQDQDDKHE